MVQTYSDPKRRDDPYALPDVEVFYVTQEEVSESRARSIAAGDDDAPTFAERGWYWWTCYPGCLPDSEPHGPFTSEEHAEMDCRDEAYDPDEPDELDDPFDEPEPDYDAPSQAEREAEHERAWKEDRK